MAEKYTYADVIIDPEDPRVEIGKEYWMANLPISCLHFANDGKRTYILKRVNNESGWPFVDSDGSTFLCLIRKKEPPYLERQAEWVEKVGLKAGDKVRILRKFDDCEQGFHCGMNSEGQMDCLVGKVVEVMEIDARSICLYNEDKSDWWVWPYFCLEKVEPEYVPFDLSKEEDRNTLRGKWVQDSRHGNEWMIVGFYLDETGGQGYKAKLSRKNAGFTGSELLERFTFLDGTPIGKLKEAGA